ncbi:hypothetical protein DJ68_04430 [Halorubrum sp. C3]|nr:hypothetical protein DJ68_04430 [Halorubrum sp. C3]
MAKWFRLYTKLYHYHYPVLGIAGMVATVIYASPGEYYISVDPLRLDIFYISIVLFGLLFIVSVTDEYGPEDYGLTSSESEK